MMNNPYAKKAREGTRGENEATKSNESNASGTAARNPRAPLSSLVPPSTSQNAQGQSTRTQACHEGASVARSCTEVAANLASTSASSLKRPRSPSLNDSFDDGGIDWSLLSSPPLREASNQPEKPSLQPKVIDLSADSSSTRPTQSTLTSATSLQAPRKESLVASLRPETWSSARPVTSYASSSTNPTPQPPPHPSQAGLPAKLQYDPATVRPVQDEHRGSLIQNASLSETLDNGWTLFPHQKKALVRSLAMRRMILALDMGLGKTLIGCVYARAFHRTFQTKTVVICPVSLQKEWRRTASEATSLELQPEKTSGLDDSSTLAVCSWAKIPKEAPKGPFVVVADEAHSMQSMTAARTISALSLMQSNNCVGVLLLTGTPMKNGRPCNLFPLLQAVQHPLGQHQRAFEAYFCGGREVSFGPKSTWIASGSAHLPQLRQLVSSHLLHLTKADCLKDLPPQTREFKTVPVSSKSQLQHYAAVQDLAKVYQQNTGGNSDLVLGAVQRVRMVGSRAKIDAAVQLARDILAVESSVVIFSSFQQVAKAIHENLEEAGWKGELLTGETPAKKRQGMVDSFQQGLSSVFVCTFGAGGVGLTLTAACTVVLVDRPWTPGDAHQAEDRVRRIGQTRPVRSIWMTAFDLDRQIDTMLEQKAKTSTAVLSRDEDPEGSGEAPRLSIFQMLKSILPTLSVEPNGLKQTSILSYSQDVHS